MQIQGGGNCANALTAAARLGAPVAIISKAGSDAAGSSIEAELQGEGIDTQCLLFSKTGPSPTTYIIVDAAGGLGPRNGPCWLPNRVFIELMMLVVVVIMQVLQGT